MIKNSLTIDYEHINFYKSLFDSVVKSFEPLTKKPVDKFTTVEEKDVCLNTTIIMDQKAMDIITCVINVIKDILGSEFSTIRTTVNKLESQMELEKFAPILDREKLTKVLLLREDIKNFNIVEEQETIFKYIVGRTERLIEFDALYSIYNRLLKRYTRTKAMYVTMKKINKINIEAYAKNYSADKNIQMEDFEQFKDKVENSKCKFKKCSYAEKDIHDQLETVKYLDGVSKENLMDSNKCFVTTLESNIREIDSYIEDTECELRGIEGDTKDCNQVLEQLIGENLIQLYEEYRNMYRDYVKAYCALIE